MHMNAHAYIHICVCAPCAFPISVSRCWSLGHVQMLYSKAYAGESCAYWLTPQMGGEGRPPACPRHTQWCHVSHLTATSIYCQGNAHRIIAICTSFFFHWGFPKTESQRSGNPSEVIVCLFPPCTAFMFSVLALLHAFVRDHVEEGDYIPATTTISITSPIKLIFNVSLTVKQNTISNKMMFECCVCSCL